MNIIVLQGDDIVKSRARLEKFIDTAKRRSWGIIYIDAARSTLAEVFMASSLFEKQRFYIIEDTSFLKKSDYHWLRNNEEKLPGTLVIFHEGMISQSVLKSLPRPHKLEEFKLPRIIFDFLASFYPRNSKRAIKLLHEVAVYEPIEFVFALLARHLRDLYLIKISPTSLTYPSWRLGRLKSQSSKFEKETLESLIFHLTNVDVEAKTGAASLLDSLDLTIVTKLQ